MTMAATTDNQLRARRKRHFWDNLIIPLAVGLILAVSTYLIPKILEAGKRLSYTAEKPTDYLSQRLEGVTIQVNGVPTASLFVTKVKLWNSGSVALKDLGVLVVFNTQDQKFKVLNIAHATKPEREFGSVTQSSPDGTSTRLVYALLNRNDEDTISFLTNESVEPTIYAKAEDLKLVQVTPTRNDKLWGISVLVSGLIGILASFLSALFTAVAKRREAKMWDSFSSLTATTAEVKTKMLEAFGPDAKSKSPK